MSPYIDRNPTLGGVALAVAVEVVVVVDDDVVVDDVVHGLWTRNFDL
jgi:hypothetical protein